jgi:RIO-like serine/threonine protein kinase
VSLDTLPIHELRLHTVQTYRAGEGTRPEVALVRVGGEQAVLKDFSRSAVWFGRVLGPLLAYREARALTLLAGISGIPRLIRKVGARALLIEHIEGVPARAMPPGSVTPELFNKLEELVLAIHEHGVAHCDLRSGGNVVVNSLGQPYLVDFVAHTVRGTPLWNWAFRRFCQADLVAVVRLKKRLAPALMSADDEHRLLVDRNAMLPRTARMIGKSVRHISRVVFARSK